jgi:hypothetical protein
MSRLKIEQIKILLDLSDPGVKEPVPFTKSVLYNPLLKEKRMANLSEYPYFTPDVKYNDVKLGQMAYDRRVRFFFNKEKFKKFLLYNNSTSGVDSSAAASADLGNITRFKKDLDWIMDGITDNLTKRNKEMEAKVKGKLTDEEKKRIWYKVIPVLEKEIEAGQKRVNEYKIKIRRITKLESLSSSPEIQILLNTLTAIEDELKKINGFHIQLNRTHAQKPLKTEPYDESDVYARDVKRTTDNILKLDDNNAKTWSNITAKVRQYYQSRTKGSVEHASKDDIIRHNIKTMLKLLCPTSYPTAIGNFDSFTKNFDGGNGYSALNLFNSFMSTYSYLKSGGKTYTITKTMWLNDILNHPRYRKELIVGFNEFNEWRNEKSEQIQDDISGLNEKISNKIAIDSAIPAVRDGLAELDAATIASGGPMTVNLTSLFARFKQEVRAIYDTNTSPTKLLTAAEFVSRQLADNGSRIPISRSLRTKLDPILQDAKRINILESINEKYFSRIDEINANFEEDDAAMKQVFTSEFKRYVDFIGKIKTFVKPNSECSNKNLQKMIYDYTQGTSDVFSFFLGFLYNKYYIEKEDATLPRKVRQYMIASGVRKEQDLLYLGVNFMENPKEGSPKYEIYVQCDVVGGELTSGNERKIKCLYEGENLGKMFEDLTRPEKSNRWLVPYDNRLFVDITVIKDATPKPAAANPDDKPAPKAKVGGRYSRRSRDGPNSHTRKRFSNLTRSHKRGSLNSRKTKRVKFSPRNEVRYFYTSANSKCS